MENSDVQRKLEEYQIQFKAKETEYGLRAEIDMSHAPIDRRLMIRETLDDFNASISIEGGNILICKQVRLWSRSSVCYAYKRFLYYF